MAFLPVAPHQIFQLFIQLTVLCFFYRKRIWLLTRTRSDTAHDDLHCLPLTRSASMLSWGVIAGPDPGSVALTTGTRTLLPEGPLWPITIHCGGTKVQILLPYLPFVQSLLYKYWGNRINPLCLIFQKHSHLDRAFLDNLVSLCPILHSGALHWRVEDYYTVSASSGTRHHRTHCKDPTLPTPCSPHELETKWMHINTTHLLPFAQFRWLFAQS